MNDVQKYILSQLEKKNISQEEAVLYLRELQERKKADGYMDVAIIGAACDVPMSPNVAEYWENISNGRNCFTAKPEDKKLLESIFKNPYYAEYVQLAQYTEESEKLEKFVGAFIKDFDKFDAGFFGIPPREARYIEPDQRIFLQTAWSAIEDAGYSDATIRNTLTGVFVGKDCTNTLDYKYICEEDPMRASGMWTGILASRINYLYNLRGPSYVVDTACSSGLVAIHQACVALMNGDCEMAIAGGISIGAEGVDIEKAFKKMDESKESLEEGGIKSIVSDDNRVRTFDKKGSGTVFGEGCVVFMLKPLTAALKDHDHIHGIIKGSAINNDGASNGLTAPNPVAQEAVVIEALKRAKIPAESMSYVECHGTGTMLGDPIEVLGLTSAYSKFTTKKQFCGIGSVKTNIGHTVGASGCASLLKVLLAMNHDMIPASLNFTEPNPHIDFVNSPLYVVDQNAKWVKDKTPRRAGISAFGFSGTNCHVIVEEPSMKRESQKAANKELILTISAKTETSLLGLLEDYVKYLSNESQHNFTDICYTSAIGRGHYGCRLALFVQSIDDMKEKIKFVIKHGLNSNEEENIFYGKYRVVPGERQKISESEITEAELRTLRQTVATIEDNITFMNGSKYSNNLIDICKMYVKGVSIEWSKFYKGLNAYKASIPTYHFEKISYWGVPKVSKINEMNALENENEKHPLIKKTLVETKDESIYLVIFNLLEQWVLQEHIILGNNLVSGTTFIEICKEALRRHFNSNKLIINYIVFLKPLIVTEQDGDVEAHVIVRKTSESVSFSVISKHISDEEIVWDEHINGTATTHSEETTMRPTYKSVSAKAHTADFATDVIKKTSNLGPRWRCCDNIFKIQLGNTDVWYTEIKLADEFKHDLDDGFKFHPSTLDSSINLVAFQVYLGSDVYLPFSYKNLKIYSDLPQHFYSQMKKLDKGNDSEVMTFHIEIIGLDGELLAEIEEYTIKKVSQFNDYYSNTYYGVRWIEESINHSSNILPEGNILIFRDNSGIADEFANKIRSDKNKIYFVNFGNTFSRISDNEFIISGAKEDYEQIFKELNYLHFSKVYHFVTDILCGGYCYDQLSINLNRGMYSLLYLTLAFIKFSPGSTDFVLVTDNAQDVTGEDKIIKPANTSFLALAKTIVTECTNYNFRCLDLDAYTDIDMIFDDILSDVKEFRTAYRDNKRFVEELKKIDNLKRVAMEKSPIRPNGVYIITGGTGGLGLETAKDFSMLAPANICLIGRNKYPEREKWDDVLQNSNDKKVCRLIRYVREIENNGSKVLIYQADTKDYEQMKLITDELKSKFGCINGVVHCAGVAGDGFLFRKTMDQFNSVVSPKIHGAAILHELTKDQTLDFFIMFSSIQTIFGGPGQGDYTAGNAFMDTFAVWLKLKGIKAFSINWPGWSQTGMAVDYNVADSVTLFKQIETQIAINALNNLILYGINNVVPGELRFDLLAKIPQSEIPIRLSEVIKRKVKRFEDKKNTADPSAEHSVIDADKLVIIGKGEDEYTLTEKIVALIYASVLNLEEIDIYESFNSMGGNSIIATEVLKVLNKQFNNSLNITDLFSYPCVEEMAAHINSIKNDGLSKVEEKFEDVKDYDEMIGDFEKGNIDIDSMIDYFSEDIKV